MLNAQKSEPELGTLETDTAKFPPIEGQIARFHIVCLECGTTGSLLSSKDGVGRELVGFTRRTSGEVEGSRSLKCNSCGQSSYELVRENL